MRNFRTLNIWKDSINIAKKVSSYELETQLIIIDELLLISKKAEITELANDINKIQKMINNLITKLKANG